jgi:hypothetical protein
MMCVLLFGKLIKNSVLLLGALLVSSAAFADTGVVGFQDWKNNRIEEAKSNLERLMSQDKPASSGRPGEKKTEAVRQEAPGSRFQAPKSARPDQRVQQAQINLEIAQELSVNDYFVLYLSQLKQRESFIEVAKKLNPEEAADLMMAYQKHLASAGQTQQEGPAPGISGVPSGRLK